MSGRLTFGTAALGRAATALVFAAATGMAGLAAADAPDGAPADVSRAPAASESPAEGSGEGPGEGPGEGSGKGAPAEAPAEEPAGPEGSGPPGTQEPPGTADTAGADDPAPAASPSPSAPEPTPTRAAASAKATPDAGQRSADLHVTKSVSPDPMVIGAESVYTVTVTNTGDEDAEDVTVTDTVSAEMSVGALSGDCSAAGQTVTCGGPGTTVPAGESVQYTIPVTVDPDVADGTDMTNSAEVSTSSSGATVDGTQLISETQTLTDIEITKTGPATANPDGTITYTMTVTNNGPSEAVEVTVEDPTNGQLTTIEDLPAECPPSGLTITCALGTLEPGESDTFTVTMSVNSDVAPGTTIENCATVYTGSRENVTDNNVSCQSTDIDGGPSPSPSPSPTGDPDPSPSPSPTTDPTPTSSPSPSPSPSPTDGGSPDPSDGPTIGPPDGGDGPNGGSSGNGPVLPVTGGSLAGITLVGAVLVAAGPLLHRLAASRRRAPGHRGPDGPGPVG
ncbi:putative repeat protein (TIGR01451 family) [Murinocardiopsis flavida]|uniref:Putative repeat protein (TIGR01451 family) n=1 Tax=Murinocardiopsis flavida TaxID=645275 RepID=A0A2P8DS65_9ACTN|nr:DUF11 domain-containing protein [Murinocardiopsis flavida]PSL00051.1 putative repeat protein (TIGR01451 family) [Murinocardiopsis flavida]